MCAIFFFNPADSTIGCPLFPLSVSCLPGKEPSNARWSFPSRLFWARVGEFRRGSLIARVTQPKSEVRERPRGSWVPLATLDTFEMEEDSSWAPGPEGSLTTPSYLLLHFIPVGPNSGHCRFPNPVPQLLAFPIFYHQRELLDQQPGSGHTYWGPVVSVLLEGPQRLLHVPN